MSQRPPRDLDWVPDNITGITVPGQTKQNAGWLVEKPARQFFNWMWNRLSRWTHYFSGQSQEWIVIDSANVNEKDYDTLAAYIADSPAVGDKVLVKETQVLTAQMIFPSGITLRFLGGVDLTRSTLEAVSIIKFGADVIIEGVLRLILSQTGTTAKAIEFNGDNVVGKISVENSSTGTLTTAYHINANKTGNRISGFVQNNGGGTLTNAIIDNSTEDSNLIIAFDETDNSIKTNGKAFVDLLNAQTIAGPKTFTDSPTISKTTPSLKINEIGATADNRLWRLIVNAEQFKLQSINDAGSATGDVYVVDRTGTTIDLFNILATALQHNGNDVITDADSASTTAEGIVELATDAETQAGTDTDRAVTPAGLASVIDSDTYTPSLTGVANVASSTVREATYTKNGTMVTVAGQLTLNVTSTGVRTQFRLTLPIPSNLVASWDLSGSGGAQASITGVDPVHIQGDPTNDEAVFIGFHSASANTLNYIFMYEIL